MFSSSSMTVSANKTASRVALTFINITITNVLILSGQEHYCELLFSDDLCCAHQQCERSVLVTFFPRQSFQAELFVFCPGISIQASVQVDPVTGLSTTSSVLEYSAKKEDTNAKFTCISQHKGLTSSPVSFNITCESANNFHWTHFLNSTYCCLQMSFCQSNIHRK